MNTIKEFSEKALVLGLIKEDCVERFKNVTNCMIEKDSFFNKKKGTHTDSEIKRLKCEVRVLTDYIMRMEESKDVQSEV